MPKGPPISAQRDRPIARETADVVVVGAGIIGCAIARELARKRVGVVVVDRDRPGRHASWAAAGMLAPQAESDDRNELLSFLLRARALFPDLVRNLEEETGVDVGYDTTGMLLVALNEDDGDALRERYEWQFSEGLAVERLTDAEVQRLEPGLSLEVRSALRFAGDHRVDNRLLTHALWQAAERAGARFLTGSAARRIRATGERLVVELDRGESLEAAVVVLAAGSWSGRIEGLPRAVPVEPIHGQLISFDADPASFQHSVASPRGYLVPRADGRLIAGTTAEKVGFRTTVTRAGLDRITTLALEIAPDLAGVPVGAHWSGLRPGTPDGLPILGRDPDWPNLIYATGHYRNGILLAPLTAQIIGDLVQGGADSVDLAPFRIDRFP